MKKILLALVMLYLTTGLAYAVVMDTQVSGNTVAFKNIEWDINSIGESAPTPTIVTFNSVTKFIRLQNLSTTADCYADLKCIDANGKRGHITTSNSCVLLPAIGRATPNTVELNFSTWNIGFIGSVPSTDKSCQTVNYVVTGDSGSF